MTPSQTTWSFWGMLFPSGAESPGERLYYKRVETLLVGSTVQLAWSWAEHTQRIREVVLPLGFARWFDISFMFAPGVAYLNAALLTLLVVCGWLRLWRGAYAGAWILLLVQYAGRFSLGEIPHSANLVGMGVLGLALAPLVFSQGQERRRFTLGFFYFCAGVAYTSAAVSKLIVAGPNWADGVHLRLWIYEKSIDRFSGSGSFELWPVQQFALDHPWFASLALIFGLLSEAAAMIIVVPRLRPLAAMMLMGLHLGIYSTMKIVFRLNMLFLVAVGVPWAAIFDRAWKKESWRRRLHSLERFAAR